VLVLDVVLAARREDHPTPPRAHVVLRAHAFDDERRRGDLGDAD
jgi:hypothetical protein